MGLGFIKWHTHLMLYVYVWVFCIGLLYLFRKKLSYFRVEKFILALSAVLISLFFIELLLHLTEVNKMSSEKYKGAYISPNTIHSESEYHTHSTEIDEYCAITSEFHYCKPVNSMGFADIEWQIEKQINEIRLITLGDSFVEGAGAPYDASYPAILRKLLSAKPDSISIMNAGVSGSDPFFDFMNLKDKLIPYKPDIVVQIIGSNDLDTDVIMRGGMERFTNKGLQYEDTPWWEPLYAINYVSRIFFEFAGYNENLTNSDLSQADMNHLNEQLISLFKKYIELGIKKDFKLVIVLRPDPVEMKIQHYTFDFSPFIEFLDKNESAEFFDLLPMYTTYIQAGEDDYKNYYWPEDRHHNSKGYEMMARCIYKKLAPILDSQSTIQ